MTVRIMIGHVMDKLRELPDESVHCVVTSPPYYGIRSYGTEPQIWGEPKPICDHVHKWCEERTRSVGNAPSATKSTLTTNGGRGPQPGDKYTSENIATVSQGAFCHCGAWRGDLGLEPTPELFIQHLVEIFREVRRVLRKDATCWINIGDSYGSGEIGLHDSRSFAYRAKADAAGPRQQQARPRGYKAKDLLMIPAQLALALRADGWWLRSEIVWAKRAPMPESVTDRPTCAHEKVFLLTKSARYFYDAEAVREDFADERMGCDGGTAGRQRNRGGRVDGFTTPSGINPSANGGRNMRNVWTLGPEPFPLAHFAVYPTEIPRRAILAGTSARGICPKCGAPWVRLVEKSPCLPRERDETRNCPPGTGSDGRNNISGARHAAWKLANPDRDLGWRPSCKCTWNAPGAEVPNPDPATVLDPFLGSGTTAMVADQLGRHCIGIELSASYAAMAERRLRDDAGMFASIAAE